MIHTVTPPPPPISFSPQFVNLPVPTRSALPYFTTANNRGQLGYITSQHNTLHYLLSFAYTSSQTPMLGKCHSVWQGIENMPKGMANFAILASGHGWLWFGMGLHWEGCMWRSVRAVSYETLINSLINMLTKMAMAILKHHKRHSNHPIPQQGHSGGQKQLKRKALTLSVWFASVIYQKENSKSQETLYSL